MKPWILCKTSKPQRSASRSGFAHLFQKGLRPSRTLPKGFLWKGEGAGHFELHLALLAPSGAKESHFKSSSGRNNSKSSDPWLSNRIHCSRLLGAGTGRFSRFAYSRSSSMLHSLSFPRSSFSNVSADPKMPTNFPFDIPAALACAIIALSSLAFSVSRAASSSGNRS